MPYDTYPYELPPLPYQYDALEPHIDTETMYYHHDKHFAAYVSNLNAALKPYPRLQKMKLSALLKWPGALPEQVQEPIMHNGGGVYNHALFFASLAPANEEGHEPSGRLLKMINKIYGSYEAFKKAFSKQALDVFGSGWTYLVLTPQNDLRIVNFKNQMTPLPMNATPIILFDVWEHAYYLKYKNLRAEYVKQLWNVVKFTSI